MRFAVVPAVIFFAQAAMAGVANVATPANFDAGVQYTVVVKDVNTLTIKSKALIVPAQQLSISNAPELILGLGPWPKVILGLGDIVATGTSVVGGIGGGSYSGTAADAIADAFREFVLIHEQLLDVLIGKAGFLVQIPFVGPPVTAVLRLIESIVDTFANTIINAVQGTANGVLRAGLGSLDGKVKQAITCYSPDGARKE